MQTIIDTLKPNLNLSCEIGQNIVYKTTLTGLETVYKKGKINNVLHSPYYELENSEMIHHSQVITTL